MLDILEIDANHALKAGEDKLIISLIFENDCKFTISLDPTTKDRNVDW